MWANYYTHFTGHSDGDTSRIQTLACFPQTLMGWGGCVCLREGSTQSHLCPSPDASQLTAPPAGPDGSLLRVLPAHLFPGQLAPLESGKQPRDNWESLLLSLGSEFTLNDPANEWTN